MTADPSHSAVSIPKLMGVMALFLVPGAVCAAFLWHVLSTLLMGRLPPADVLTAAVAVLVLLLAIVRGLWYSLRRYGPGAA